MSASPSRHEKLLVSFLPVMSCARNVKHRFAQPRPTNNVKHKSMGGQRPVRKPGYKLGFVTGTGTKQLVIAFLHSKNSRTQHEDPPDMFSSAIS